MKTSFNIDAGIVAKLTREAARRGRTMSELVETALHLLLRLQRRQGNIPALPKLHSGGTLVDISNRDALYDAIERQ